MLTDLPLEILESILILCDPQDISRTAQTCQFFRCLMYRSLDEAIWRENLTKTLDDPRQCSGLLGEERPFVSWRKEVQRITRAGSLIKRMSIGRPGELADVLQTLLDLVTYTAITPGPSNGHCLSKNRAEVRALLDNGWIDFVKGEAQSLSPKEWQLLNRLHTYYGLTPDDISSKPARAVSRSYVYNMRNYTWDNEFGPYDDDGNVNWVHVNAIRHLVAAHLVSIDIVGDADPFPAIKPSPEKHNSLSLPYIQPRSPADIGCSNENDWAGVEGRWVVAFCFCDHSHLLVFNQFIDRRGFPEDTTMFELDEFQEVFRLMRVNIRITSTEHDPKNPAKPTLYFAGAMADLNNSVMTGNVKMTKDGNVRWRFVCPVCQHLFHRP
ncbi:hypothetical protein FA15DRAFT_669012 [Coprinopsis marcescibilis]|uniref:F-box domain-containing protein n=1 Tax=Coprinopsis marcescibilis TaxID=230819 RepID=A0A5C3KX09_COPMA|nr:hypothetical protein FA15DRAFT_669012 [Coprinopsis marcescibilis]